jgi:hypothetical protein
LAGCSDSCDHHFSGLHQGGRGLAFAELHLAHGIGGDDGGDTLGADLEDDLRKQAADLNLDDGADELIASAHIAEPFARGGGGRPGGGGKVALESGRRDAVMAACGLDGLEFACNNPLFNRG